MRRIANNRIVVDLNKVQYAEYFYTNDTGQTRNLKPKYPTVNGVLIKPGEFAPETSDWPRETMLERAKRRNLIDIWTPVLLLKLSANSNLTYTGVKATSIWKEWNRRQFEKKKMKK